MTSTTCASRRARADRRDRRIRRDQARDVIAPFAATTPTTWPIGTPGGFGISILNHADWGNRPTRSDPALQYVGPRVTPTKLATIATGASATFDLAARLNVSASQPVGTYTGVMTVVVVAQP